MNILIENTFVNNFICTRLKNRIAFELSSPKHRRKAISRFSHNIEDTVVTSKIILKSNNINFANIDRIIKQNIDNINEVYVISTNIYNGNFTSYKEALQTCIDDYMPTILIINNNFAFIKTEAEIGAPTIYFLKY